MVVSFFRNLEANLHALFTHGDEQVEAAAKSLHARLLQIETEDASNAAAAKAVAEASKSDAVQ